MSQNEGPVAVYTLGHGDRELPELLACLRSFSVSIVADVRSWPVSRRYPWFRRETLEAALVSEGITYRFLGRDLGGLRADGYEAHTRTPAFQDGLRHLADLVRQAPTAVLCAERDPAECHRRHIAAALAAEGFAVLHIEGPGRLYPALPSGGTQGTLFPL